VSRTKIMVPPLMLGPPSEKYRENYERIFRKPELSGGVLEVIVVDELVEADDDAALTAAKDEQK
jgi:hypothetical protein